MIATKEKRMATGIRQAFTLIRKMAEDPDKYPENCVFIGRDAVRDVFTAERVRLLETLRSRKGAKSVTDLADALGRDVTRVSRDVAALESYGLVELERDGKAKRIKYRWRPVVVV